LASSSSWARVWSTRRGRLQWMSWSAELSRPCRHTPDCSS
jgi:hypothetical protein